MVELLAAALAVIFLCACGEESAEPGEAACVPDLDLECQPLFDPSYDEIFARTLLPSCGVGGSSCHSEQGQQAGLVFADADASHTFLVDTSSLVLPADPACSEIVKRLEADDLSRAMPPGSRLSEGERCAIERWIADGAQR